MRCDYCGCDLEWEDEVIAHACVTCYEIFVLGYDE